MEPELKDALDKLQAALARAEADNVVDDDERAELRTLVDRLGAVLADPEEDHEGVTEHLEEAAVRFDGNHPTLSAMIRAAVDTLTGYGI